MDESIQPGDCCPLSDDDIETKDVSFGPRMVRPDSFDAYVDKESARARARMLGCIGIRQYGSTNGGTVWMPCSNESDYRRVTGTNFSGRRQRRRMLKAELGEGISKKALGATIGMVGGRVNTNPATAIDADLDGLVLEGLPFINLGRGVPDPTPGGTNELLPNADNRNFAMAAMSNRRGPRISPPGEIELSRDGDDSASPATRMPSQRATRSRKRETTFADVDTDRFDELIARIADDVASSEVAADVSSDEAVGKLLDDVRGIASSVAEVVDGHIDSRPRRSTSTRDAAEETSTRITAKAIGTVMEISNNPTQSLSENENLTRLVTSSIIERGAAEVASLTGKPGIWAFLVQAMIGGAYATQRAWELLARIFGVENNTGWVPEPTGRFAEALAPSLANERKKAARSRALDSSGRAIDALRQAGFAISDASEVPAIADDMASALDSPELIELPGDKKPGPAPTLDALDEIIQRINATTGKTRPRGARKPSYSKYRGTSEEILRNRMDIAGVPSGIDDVYRTNSVDVPTDNERLAAKLISTPGRNGQGALNAELLYRALSDRSALRSYVSPVDSPFVAQLATLIEEGRLPRLADALLEMSPQTVENFLAVPPRPIISAARAARKTLRPSGSWMARISNDPFETAFHMLRAKDYHLSSIFSGADSGKLTDAVDELVGNNVSETAAIFGSLVALNKERLAEAYDGSQSVAQGGNRLLRTARNLIASATENDSVWAATRDSISDVTAAMLGGDSADAAMSRQVVRFGSNYPRHRRKTGDWSPIANKIRDGVKAYRARYGPIASNSADLSRFVNFSYPELLSEASELIDLMKEKVEFGSLKFEDYARNGWINRDTAELDVDEFDPTNLETIFDKGSQMGLFKSIGVVLVAASRVAPSRDEREAVLDLMDEVNEWTFTALPLYSEPRSVTDRRRGIFPSSASADAGMTVNRPVPDDVRQTLMSLTRPYDSGQTQGLPTIRMQRKLVEKANELMRNDLPDDLAQRMAASPNGPTIDISELFLGTAEQFRWDQATIASFYEEVAEMMNRMVQEVPDAKRRQKLADMFTGALEDIADNMDNENTEFFDRVGDIPSRTVGRLSRRASRSQVAEDTADAGMTVNRGVPEDVRETLMSRQSPLGSGEKLGLPERRISRKLTEVANDIFAADRIANDSPLPSPGIAEVFFNTAGQLRWDRPTTESFFEDVRRMMNQMVSEIPDSTRRNRLADVFSEALSDIENRINAGMKPIGTPDADAGIRGRDLPDRETTVLFDGVMEVVSSLDNNPNLEERDSPESLREKLRVVGITGTLGNDEDFDNMIASVLPTMGRTEESYSPTSGVSKAAMDDLDYMFYEVMNELNMSTEDPAEEFVRRLRRQFGVSNADQFHDLIRSVSTQSGIGSRGEYVGQVYDGSYLTTSAIKSRIRATVPGFYEALDSMESEDVSAGMAGPTIDRLRNNVLEARRIRELGKIAEIDDAKDYAMRTVEARRRRLIGMSEPGGFIEFVARGVTDQRSPLSLTRIAQAKGGYEKVIRDADPDVVNAIWGALGEFVRGARGDFMTSTPSNNTRLLYRAAVARAIFEDAEFKPISEGNFTDDELLAKLGVGAYEDLLPNNSMLTITESDIDAVPSVRSKAAQALEILAMDRTQLIQMLTNDATRPETQQAVGAEIERIIKLARDRIDGQRGKLEYVPTSDHMKQISLAELISPLDGETLAAFVEDLTDAQLTSLQNVNLPEQAASQLVNESKRISWSSAARKMVALSDLHGASVAEASSLASRLDALLATGEMTENVSNLVRAIQNRDAEEIARLIGATNVAEPDEERSILRALYEFSRNAEGESISAMLPPAIDEATDLAIRRSKAIVALKSQPDGGRGLARRTIDTHPRQTKGYDLVRTVPDATPEDEKLFDLGRAIQDYNGSTESAVRLVYSLTDLQLQNLRNNYIIPSILQRMDHAAFEKRKQSGLIAETRARIDNLGRRLGMMSMAPGSGNLVEETVGMIDDALATAFGERATEISALTPEERETYTDIIDYFVSGGRESFEDPSEYGRRLRGFRDSVTPSTDPGSGEEDRSGGGTATDDYWDIFDDGNAGMSDGKKLNEEAARRIFPGVEEYVKTGTRTETTSLPITDDRDTMVEARRIIAALYDVAVGRIPDDIAEKMRADGSLATSQAIYPAVVQSTLRALASADGMPFDFRSLPNDYDPRNDKDIDRRNFFLGAMTELVALHVALGLPEIVSSDPTRTPNNISIDLHRDDFLMVLPPDLDLADDSKLRFSYDPQGRAGTFETWDDAATGEFDGDPESHPTVIQIADSIAQLRRLFPGYNDWLDQANRYSRTLAPGHYEKNKDFGESLIDQLKRDPSALDLDKVMRAITATFPDREGEESRMFADAASLPPDPDDVSDFPDLSSYPDPDVMTGSDMPRDRISKQRKIAISPAKASVAARQAWWSSFTSGTLMDEYEIAAITKTTDGDNFHPEAILSGLKKYARDNGIDDSTFSSLRAAATKAAAQRYNAVALQKTIATLNDIAMRPGGIPAELRNIASEMKRMDNITKEISRHYQDRIRARIQTLYSTYATLYKGLMEAQNVLKQRLADGEITPQGYVDDWHKAYRAVLPAILSASRQIGELSSKANATRRVLAALEVQKSELNQRVQEIQEATRLTSDDMQTRMQMLRDITNGLSHAAKDPSALNDDTNAGMSIGRSRFGIVGSSEGDAPRTRELMTRTEKRFVSEANMIGNVLSTMNMESMRAIPNMRAALSALRNGSPSASVPPARLGTESEMGQLKNMASVMFRADLDAESMSRSVMGNRFLRFSDIARMTLPDFTRRITEDIITSGIAATIMNNGVGESDVDSALIMLAQSTENMRNMAVYNHPSVTAKAFGVTEDDVSDAIATESLITRSSRLLRSAQSYALSLSGAYSEDTVRRMTMNRFPELESFDDEYLRSLAPSDQKRAEASRQLNSAISRNKLVKLSPRSVPLAYGVSEDVASLISAASATRTPPRDLRNTLPSDWEFMTFRDRQLWLGSEEAFNTLGKLGVNDELTELQRQIEDFGSMDGPYPAIARAISGNRGTRGLFGRELILPNGRSPIYDSTGLAGSELKENGRNQISLLLEAVPGMDQLSDRGLAKFLNTDFDTVSKLKRPGMAVAPEGADRMAAAFGIVASDIWPAVKPSADTDPGNFYWLASTWDRSGEAIRSISEGIDPAELMSEMDNSDFIYSRVQNLVNDGTVERFYDALGLEEITAEDASAYATGIAPRSRKAVVELLASSGYREQDIVDATGFNPNTVRNSLHELRKQGLIPDVVGGPGWVAKNSRYVMDDFNAGQSKRSLMKKYGIGARTLDSIIQDGMSRGRIPDAYTDGADAGMANRRLPDKAELSDGPSENWRTDRSQRADGTPIAADTQKPPAVVANPFFDPASPAALSISGEPKDPDKTEIWKKAISDYISFAIEGGFFTSSPDPDPAKQVLMAMFNERPDVQEPVDRVDMPFVTEYPPRDANKSQGTGRDYGLFAIATRQENPDMYPGPMHAMPFLATVDFDAQGIYRGIMPMLRDMILATWDKSNRQENPELYAGHVRTEELIEAGLLDEPEMPQGFDDEMRAKLWQLRQVMRNPMMVDAPPLFEPGDLEMMNKVLPLMAAADEQNELLRRFGSTTTEALRNPSPAIGPTVAGNTLGQPEDFQPGIYGNMMSGVPMFSNLLLSAALEGNAEVKSLLDSMTPRQIMLTNWAYSLYSAVGPIIESFGRMMPVSTIRTPNINIPDEAGTRTNLGDVIYRPVPEVDDQVFAFVFDSIFKALQGVAERPDDLIVESLPYGKHTNKSKNNDFGVLAQLEVVEMPDENMLKLKESVKILARLTANALATNLYRRAGRASGLETGYGRTPFTEGSGDGTQWFRYARPRLDSYGHWSMYGPNIVYAGEGRNPYTPGWSDEETLMRESMGQPISESAEDAETLKAMQTLLDEMPGEYWWQASDAAGTLTDEQIIAMHPEEFAHYVANVSALEDGPDMDKVSQLLRRAFGNLATFDFPRAELDQFDEWVGGIIRNMPSGSVTQEGVLKQLKNIFPWLDINRMDDVYPVTGRTLEEAMNTLGESLNDMTEDEKQFIAASRPFLLEAGKIVSSPVGVALMRERRNQFILPIIMGLMDAHRTNMTIGYRSLASFKEGLRRARGAYEPSDFERQLRSMFLLVKEMEEKGQIGPSMSFKLGNEILRAQQAVIFDNVDGFRVLREVFDRAEIGEDWGDIPMTDLSYMLRIIEDNFLAGQGDPGEGADLGGASQQEIIDRFVGAEQTAMEALGDNYGKMLASGIYGSVKTLGEAAREIAPFIRSSERTRRRRSLLPRYKREVIDPLADRLLTDAEKMDEVLTFNDWLDANGYPDLNTDKGTDDGGANAGMSATTRMVISRFTDDAAQSVREAYQEASNGSDKVTVGHLLLGIAAVNDMDEITSSSVQKYALRGMGLNLKRLREALASVTTPSETGSARPSQFTSAARRTLIGAVVAASERGEEVVDAGDIIIAAFDARLRGNSPDDDGVTDALMEAGIIPSLISANIAAARTGSFPVGSSDPSAAMGAGRRANNSADRKDDLMRNKLQAQASWFNAGRPTPIATGTATDGQLVDEVARLMDIFNASVTDGQIDDWDLRAGESPFSRGAVMPTNSTLVHGWNGQEPSDLVGAIRFAIDRASALVTDDRETARLSRLLSDMRLYFDNDEHLSQDGKDASAGMAKDFRMMIEPIRELFGRNESANQRRYYEGIYGDVDLSEGEIRKAARSESLAHPFTVDKNLSGTEDDINWSTSQWSYNKDETFVEAADSVMVRMRDGDISTAEVAAISRKSGPFRDSLALVGGLRDGNEDLMTTATRETSEEVGVFLDNASQVQNLGVIESPDWDPRFVNGARVGAGLFVIPWDTQLVAASDAAGARWVPLAEIAAGQHRLAFGHAEWIRRAVAAMEINPSSDPYGDIRLSIARRLGILAKASRLRNQKLIAQINSMRRATGRKQFIGTDRMPHPMMPWGNRVSKSTWEFGPGVNAGMSSGNLPDVDDSLPRRLGLLSVTSDMSASQLEQGYDTAGFYGVGHSRGGDDMFAAWRNKDRVEKLWRPYVEASLETARAGDIPNDQKRPVVFVLGGGSGVGKSTARNSGLFGIPNYDSAVVADPDDAKIMMPEARLWYARRLPEASSLAHTESRQVTAVLARAATKEGLDMVYDTSGQFNDGFQDIKDWRKAGYEVVAHYFFAPESILQDRVAERERRTGRGVPPWIVKQIQWNLTQMLPDFIARGAFDELYIWDTEKDVTKPLLVGQMSASEQGQPAILQLKHPYLLRYLFRDRVAPDGGKIEPRKTTAITIPRAQGQL